MYIKYLICTYSFCWWLLLILIFKMQVMVPFNFPCKISGDLSVMASAHVEHIAHAFVVLFASQVLPSLILVSRFFFKP